VEGTCRCALHARPLSLWWRCGYVVKTAGWPRMAFPTVARAPRGVSCGWLEEMLMECSPSRCFVTLILSLLMVPGDVGWRWTGGAGGEKRAPPGCPEGTASGRATWARERAALRRSYRVNAILGGKEPCSKRIVLCTALITFSMVLALHAQHQPAPIKRTILQRADVPGTNSATPHRTPGLRVSRHPCTRSRLTVG